MDCCMNPADNPNTLEYGKKRKPEHNAGCGCSCTNQVEEDDEETTTVVTQRLTREDYV